MLYVVCLCTYAVAKCVICSTVFLLNQQIKQSNKYTEDVTVARCLQLLRLSHIYHFAL